MKYLFLDTTNNLSLGLLDEKFEWIELVQIETKKTSEIIHQKIYELLGKHNLTANSEFEIISIAGPGSYTGMRITEGVCQIFELEGKKIYSVHSFMLPEYMGIDWDYCCYPAFKNEIYIHSKDSQSKLVSLGEFENDYINGLSRLLTYGDNFNEKPSIINIKESFLKNPSVALLKIVQLGLRQEPFYFRPVEVEFKQNL